MIDTPVTDAATHSDVSGRQWTNAAVARDLERQLQAALMVQNSTVVQDTGELVRYGIRWRGPREPIADSTLPGGYWTPWHIAQERLSAAQAAQQKAEQQLRDAHSASVSVGAPDKQSDVDLASASVGAPDLTTDGGTQNDVRDLAARVPDEHAEHIAKNAQALRQWDGMEHESRARELAGAYLRECAECLRLDRHLAELDALTKRINAALSGHAPRARRLISLEVEH